MGDRLRLGPVGLGLVMLVGLTGCAAYPQTEALLATPPDGLPRRAEVANVRFLPHVEQQGAPSALAMALEWAGAPSTVEILVPSLKGDGLQSEIIAATRKHGRQAFPVGDLRGVLEELAAGHPVLVRQEPSGRPEPIWRYALVIGYDLDHRIMHVHSGQLERIRLPLQVFETNWQRADNWAVVVLPPGQQPASLADQSDAKIAAAVPPRNPRLAHPAVQPAVQPVRHKAL